MVTLENLDFKLNLINEKLDLLLDGKVKSRVAPEILKKAAGPTEQEKKAIYFKVAKEVTEAGQKLGRAYYICRDEHNFHPPAEWKKEFEKNKQGGLAE